jgi:hypothetical protein
MNAFLAGLAGSLLGFLLAEHLAGHKISLTTGADAATATTQPGSQAVPTNGTAPAPTATTPGGASTSVVGSSTYQTGMNDTKGSWTRATGLGF